MLTHERLLELLTYDPGTGLFHWRLSLTWRRPVGSLAGTLTRYGYLAIGLEGRKYYAQRLAWFYVHGVWPPSGVDHKDRIKTNNKIDNLRLADQTQNMANSSAQKRNKTGFKGVLKKRKRFQARITFEGRSLYFGVYDTPEEAHAAYCEAAKNLFGEFHAP